MVGAVAAHGPADQDLAVLLVLVVPPASGEYVIRGKVCLVPTEVPSPAPTSARYDVDWWFWWINTELVGCATTDINGAFQISFRWCCGLWPWWWWAATASAGSSFCSTG